MGARIHEPPGLVQALIATLVDKVSSLEKRIMMLGPGSRMESMSTSRRRSWTSMKRAGQHKTKIGDLENFLILKKWSKPKGLVIGFVRWVPSVAVGVAPRRCTRDLYVVELDEKFRSMIGNVLRLGSLLVNLFATYCWSRLGFSLSPGPEMSKSKLKSLMSKTQRRPVRFQLPQR